MRPCIGLSWITHWVWDLKIQLVDSLILRAQKINVATAIQYEVELF
jgi:hypothetical protein